MVGHHWSDDEMVMYHRRSLTRSKCVFTMNLTQAGQWGAVGTKSGPRGPSEDPKGPFRAKTSPFRARYQVKVCIDHESNSGRPMGGRWDQIWPPMVLRQSGICLVSIFLPALSFHFSLQIIADSGRQAYISAVCTAFAHT